MNDLAERLRGYATNDWIWPKELRADILAAANALSPTAASATEQASGMRAALELLSDNFEHGWSKGTRHETIQAVERIAKNALAAAAPPHSHDGKA